MAIYGIGAYYDRDVSYKFIENNLAGAGWSETNAPEIHRFIRSLKVGDIVYIKSYPPGSADIHVKAVGLIADDAILDHASTQGLVRIGRRVRWVDTNPFDIPRPSEKNNVRANTIYEEFHPKVQREIMSRVLSALTE